MSSFSTRALTLLSSVFGACGLLLVGVAVSTDYWLLMEEGIVLQQNQTTEVKMALHSGLWRVCFVAGRCYLVVLRFYHLPTLLPKPLIKTQVIVDLMLSIISLLVCQQSKPFIKRVCYICPRFNRSLFAVRPAVLRS